MIKHYEFEIGDLVQFSEYSFFDEYYNSFEKIVGIVVERSFKHVEDTTYKIKANEKDYWIEEDKITLLSKAPKGVSK
jgi:hypothetical protein